MATPNRLRETKILRYSIPVRVPWRAGGITNSVRFSELVGLRVNGTERSAGI